MFVDICIYACICRLIQLFRRRKLKLKQVARPEFCVPELCPRPSHAAIGYSLSVLIRVLAYLSSCVAPTNCIGLYCHVFWDRQYRDCVTPE